MSHEEMDLRYNSRLETVSFWRCGSAVIQHTGLAIFNQISSSNVRVLNICFRDDSSIGQLTYPLDNGREGVRELALIDTILQRPNFANLEELNVGFPKVVESMPDFFPRTAARGLLHVRRGSEMARLARAKEEGKL